MKSHERLSKAARVVTFVTASSLIALLPDSSAIARAQETTTIFDPGSAQALADKNFAAWDAEISTSYPWLNKLPITSKNYYANFDIGTKGFSTTFFTNASLDSPEIESSKTEVLTRLQELIPDSGNYPMEWKIQPTTR